MGGRRRYRSGDTEADAPAVFLRVFFAELIDILPRGDGGKCGDYDISNIIRIVQAGIAKEWLRAEDLLLALCEIDTEQENSNGAARDFHGIKRFEALRQRRRRLGWSGGTLM
jgi:hypothetical protein